MARIKNFMQMTGSMANVSMYTMQGHDEVIIRTKGGPTKKQIKTKPQFDLVRRNNSEWSGCAKMGSQIRMSFYVMKRLEDYPLMGAVNAICKHIQKLDTESELGKRSVSLSKHKDIVCGLSFSKKQVLESVLRIPINTTINRISGKATIEIPTINTDLYLYNFRNLPYFRIIAVFSGVADMIYLANEKRYVYQNCGYTDKAKGVYESDWLSTNGTHPGINLTLEYPLIENPIPTDVTLMLCIGVEFGKNGYANIIEPVKYAGTGKVVKVG